MISNGLALAKERLRIEFGGKGQPSHLVVPIVFQPGSHRKIGIRICPREGIRFSNEVHLGDALTGTFSHSRGGAIGGSFFATANYSTTLGYSAKLFEVVALPDFRGILLRLTRYDVEDEPVGIEFAFPLKDYDPAFIGDHFAEVTLETEQGEVERHRIPREVHPRAGKILLVGWSNSLFESIGQTPLMQGRVPLGPGLVVTSVPYTGIESLVENLRSTVVGLHVYTPTVGEHLYLDGRKIATDEFFDTISGHGVKVLYLATCNSVRIVSLFRRTDIGALIAATENLAVDYANEFERTFYALLSRGSYVSESFQEAALRLAVQGTPSPYRSRTYEPMFLDLRADFRISVEGGA